MAFSDMSVENIDNEFLIARVKKCLSGFIVRLDEVFKTLDETDSTKDEIIVLVEEIQSDIGKEKARALSSNNPFFAECDYIGALDWVLDFLKWGLASQSPHKLSSALYGASLSAGFYLHHM